MFSQKWVPFVDYVLLFFRIRTLVLEHGDSGRELGHKGWRIRLATVRMNLNGGGGSACFVKSVDRLRHEDCHEFRSAWVHKEILS